MTLQTACKHIFHQLSFLVENIEEADFTKPSDTLSHSTVGQHFRHTLEFFQCFEAGFASGIINYDKRAHNKAIETSRTIALNTVNHIMHFIQYVDCDKPLKLEIGYDLVNDVFITIDTNAARELVYNIEHAVHHMAIMKIGIREVAPYLQLPPDFGIAASTFRYKETRLHQAYS